jgi:hypothetical protein
MRNAQLLLGMSQRAKGHNPDFQDDDMGFREVE